MKNFIQEGETITWTNGSTAVAAGDVVIIGSLLGVACVDIANGATGAVALEGVFTLPKTAGASAHGIAKGESILYDVSAAKFDLGAATPATGDMKGAFVAWDAAATTDTTVNVKICCVPNTVT